MSRRELFDARALERALRRLAMQIVEGAGPLDDLALVGVRTRGVPIAQRLAAHIDAQEGVKVPVGELDITLYRDDVLIGGGTPEVKPTRLPFDVAGRHVVLVDDVLFTGRTIRAALDAICDFGRPRSIQLAVMVDRGHRELPIRPDFVGKNLPTRRDEVVDVHITGVDLGVMEK